MTSLYLSDTMRTKWHGARQIGNSVPPPLARALGEAIIESIGFRLEPPHKTLELGSPAQLAFDMRRAAQYWNVPVPVGKRDRKSGATKRSQEEIEAERVAGHLR